MFHFVEKNLNNRKQKSQKHVLLLENALAKKDFQQLKALSQELYLENNSGFALISVFGKMIERTAIDKDVVAMESLLTSFKLYLKNTVNPSIKI
ncbi:MAG: hypothetical protein HY819_09770 [Acidobacteria bacterium]|nr:hypothetical protein [Acidobacteriota bacterium]